MLNESDSPPSPGGSKISGSLGAALLRFLESVPTNRWILFLGALLAAGCLIGAMDAGLDWDATLWNDVRLSRAYAALGGADLYSGPDEGVLAGHLYGPMGFYLYAPVRLASTPGAAIRIGIVVSALIVLIPFAWILRRKTVAGPRDETLWIPAFLFAVFHFFWSSSSTGLWMIHVDAPTVGLALVSYWSLLRALDNPQSLLWIWATAGASAAAVWSKQTMAPALILPAAILWINGQSRAARQVFGLTALCAAAFGAIFGWLYGFGDLWFTMFEVPSRHGRYFGRLLMDFDQFGTLVDLLPLAAIVFYAGRQAVAAHSIGIAALYALALTPFAALGRLKVSGSGNNYLGPDVFLTLSLCLAVSAVIARNDGPWKGRAQALLGLALLLQMGRTAQFLAHDAYLRSINPEIGASDEAYQYLLENPGAAYFPWHPLAMHMAEGKLFHAGHGILTRNQAGYPVSEQQWRSHVPQGPRFLVTPKEPNGYLLEHMPKFQYSVAHPDLPRWVVRQSSPRP